jgi:hypothetical protein
MMKPTVRGEDVEWGYAFDVHLNAYFPALIILHVVQSIFYHGALLFPHHLFLSSNVFSVISSHQPGMVYSNVRR